LTGGRRRGTIGALVVVFVLVILALLSGVITTAVIINRVAGSHRLPERPESPEAQKELAGR
jgi:hypothetical protein